MIGSNRINWRFYYQTDSINEASQITFNLLLTNLLNDVPLQAGHEDCKLTKTS